MPKSLIFVYFVSILLFSYHASREPQYFTQQKNPDCPWLYVAKNKSINEITGLKTAFLCGSKTGLKKNTKLAYKNLNLYHLFTPSGIHLGIFYMLNFPILNWMGKKSKKLTLFYKVLLSIWPWFLNGFYSLKRIGGMHLTKLAPLHLSAKQTFFIFFIFDFFFGTYKQSPLSWTFSFLFLGIVFHCYKKSFLSFSLYLFSGQLLAAIFSYQKIYPLSFLPSFIITAIFTPVFITTFFDNFLNLVGLNLLNPLSEGILYLFNEIVIFTNYFLEKTFTIKPEIFALTFVFGLLFQSKKIIFLSLLLNSSRIYNLPDSRARQSAYILQHDIFFNDSPTKIKINKQGSIRMTFPNKRQCSLKFFNYGKTKKCHFRKI